jgi:hypothetical protein
MATEKPKLVKGEEPRLSITGTIEAKLLLDLDKYQNGSMLMRIADTDAEVTQGDEIVGHIGMAMGGAFYVQIGGRTWRLDLMQIFELVRKAESEQYATCNSIASK